MSTKPDRAARIPVIRLFEGDSAEVLKQLPDNSVDSVVCDPPYGLSKEPDMLEVLRHWMAGDDYTHKGGGFMGKSWDSFVPGPAIWRECLRVLKPGGHLLAFFGSRTYDMGTLAIRLAGFEIRDQIMWVYGSGFPKSLNVGKAIDKAAGAEREIIGFDPAAAARAVAIGTNSFGDFKGQTGNVTAPATDAAIKWDGWGTALKPAHEPICVARKPLAGTVAANVMEHGTGALNIDGCRIVAEDGQNRARPPRTANSVLGGGKGTNLTASEHNHAGRWPANLVHDGSDEVLAAFPDAKGQQGALTGDEPSGKMGAANCYGKMDRRHEAVPRIDTSKSAARFFYCAKASKSDRDYGLSGEVATSEELVNRKEGSAGMQSPRAGAGRTSGSLNRHATVKPVALMRYLVRLVTPPGGVTLDPFMGSGSTGVAAMLEGFKFVGVEQEAQSFQDANTRIQFARRDYLSTKSG